MLQEALIQENEVAEALAGRGCLFEDPAFPASAESLYRTPQQPPAGALPAALAVWGRVSQQEVRGCHTPVTFPVGKLEWRVFLCIRSTGIEMYKYAVYFRENPTY